MESDKIFFIYSIVSILINYIMIFTPFEFKVDYYKGKFTKPKDVLYRLETSGYNSYYSVSKYKIVYDRKEIPIIIGLIILFIPFASIIKVPRYQKINIGYGEFSSENIHKLKPFDLGEYWENKHREYCNIIDDSNKKLESLKILNKDFDDNY